MRKVLVVLIGICLLLTSVFANSSPNKKVLIMPDEFMWMCYSETGDKDFPDRGKAQLRWFKQRNELFEVVDGGSFKKISKFGSGDIIYFLDKRGKYLHCFMINKYDKKRNKISIIGAMGTGENYHIYLDKEAKESWFSLAELVQLNKNWKSTYVGSKGSIYKE